MTTAKGEAPRFQLPILQGVLPISGAQVPAEIVAGLTLAAGAQAVPGLLIYRFTHSMYYANSQQLSDEIMGLANRAEPALRWLCIDASAVDDVDYSAAETIRSLCGMLKEKGIRLVVAGVMEDVRAESRYEIRQLFGEDAYYGTLDDVVKAYQQEAG